jgi:hypothetical protein
MLTPLLGPDSTFTVVNIPNDLDSDAFEQYEQDNWIDLIWSDVTLEQYGRICRGTVRQNIGHEKHYFFRSTVPVIALIQWLKSQIFAQHTAGVRGAVSTKLTDSIDCEDILGGTVTQDGGFCADLNRKPGKAQYIEKAARIRRARLLRASRE